jgi:hypothetical protein
MSDPQTTPLDYLDIIYCEEIKSWRPAEKEYYVRIPCPNARTAMEVQNYLVEKRNART